MNNTQLIKETIQVEQNHIDLVRTLLNKSTSELLDKHIHTSIETAFEECGFNPNSTSKEEQLIFNVVASLLEGHNDYISDLLDGDTIEQTFNDQFEYLNHN